ncbi:MAG: hypothetical protein N3G21_05220 [Candidatus Hydrogenedentes bacterium]|nr:hypothetical protein [Candidatus Hydrogenedentota bacterium]
MACGRLDYAREMIGFGLTRFYKSRTNSSVDWLDGKIGKILKSHHSIHYPQKVGKLRDQLGVVVMWTSRGS